MKNLIIKENSFPFVIFYTLFAIGINFCGSILAETIVFPLYLDSVLSISVVALCGYIPGVRPGKETKEYINTVIGRITFLPINLLNIVPKGGINLTKQNK